MSVEGQREIDLCRVWADRALSGDMRLIDGRRLHVIYPGIWSNSNGPDFLDALLSIDGRLVRGAVEMHLRASGWYRHQHDKDTAYNDVALHVVLDNDLPDAVLTAKGASLPTLALPELRSERPHDGAAAQIMAQLGTRTCLPETSREQPTLVRDVLHVRGWSRLVEKQLRFSQELQVLTAPEVLYRGLLDALGFSANRQGMAEVGRCVPLQLLERLLQEEGETQVLAALLGTGGFVGETERLSNGNAQRSNQLAGAWAATQARFALEPVPDGIWTLNRVRPQNHPATRLASLASLIGSTGRSSLFEHVLALRLDGGKSWDQWLAQARPAIGESRRRQIIVNIIAPFMAAYAEVTRDEQLAEEVAADWERLPGAVTDSVARRTRRQIVGLTRFPIRTALEEQGLHEIHRSGCAELRCFECPIARLAVKHEPWGGAASGQD